MQFRRKLGSKAGIKKKAHDEILLEAWKI